MKNNIAKTGLFKVAHDDVAGGALFCNEQHLLAGRNGTGDQIGDGLTLAGAGRTLDDNARAVLDGQERPEL